MMDEGDDSKATWWVLYPLRGLDVTDDYHELDEPIFGDVAVISKQHIRQIVPLLKLNERMSPGHDHERDITYMLEHATLKEEFQSFIAVRRTGFISDEGHEPPLVKDARLRAYQFAALLALVFLAKSKSGQTCGLVEQLHDQTKSTVMLTFQEPRFRFQVGGAYSFTIRDSRETIKLSRDELRQILDQEPYEALARALLPQRAPLPKSLHHSISQSAIRLSDAVHSIIPSSQLLGAITSIEILLTHQTDKYESIKERLLALLGTDAVLKHNIESVLHSRHLYVHQGEEVSERSIPVKAVGLALSCLLRYAQIAPNFSDKNKLIEYLDFIYKSDKVSPCWTEEESRAFAVLQKHARSAHEFPFMELVNTLR